MGLAAAVVFGPALPLPRTTTRPFLGGLAVFLTPPRIASPPVFCFLLCLEGELVDAYDNPFFLLGVEGADGSDAATARVSFGLDNDWSLD